MSLTPEQRESVAGELKKLAGTLKPAKIEGLRGGERAHHAVNIALRHKWKARSSCTARQPKILTNGPYPHC